MLPLATNARAKMQGVRDGFVKLFIRPGTGIIAGGVVVGPRASELIHPISLAVSEGITADQFAHAFTVYPSMSGSVAEAARRLHRVEQYTSSTTIVDSSTGKSTCEAWTTAWALSERVATSSR